jgi:hypothetical protein
LPSRMRLRMLKVCALCTCMAIHTNVVDSIIVGLRVRARCTRTSVSIVQLLTSCVRKAPAVLNRKSSHIASHMLWLHTALLFARTPVTVRDPKVWPKGSRPVTHHQHLAIFQPDADTPQAALALRPIVRPQHKAMFLWLVTNCNICKGDVSALRGWHPAC